MKFKQDTSKKAFKKFINKYEKEEISRDNNTCEGCYFNLDEDEFACRLSEMFFDEIEDAFSERYELGCSINYYGPQPHKTLMPSRHYIFKFNLVKTLKKL